MLLVVSPDAKLPPEEVQKFFESLTQKNNLCILTGDKTPMASLDMAARRVFAASKADVRIRGDPSPARRSGEKAGNLRAGLHRAPS